VVISGGRSNVRIAYIPQQDIYFDMLTCEEALILASKLKNATFAQTGDFLRYSVVNAGKDRSFEHCPNESSPIKS
jgi:ABC-type branched-subunit amino acid transport system ATPase component